MLTGGFAAILMAAILSATLHHHVPGQCPAPHVQHTLHSPSAALTSTHLCCPAAVVPNGITTGLDIGFSNMSLVFINLSFYTMCKATSPVFLLLFAFIWGIEK